jgi:hypothetical protein
LNRIIFLPLFGVVTFKNYFLVYVFVNCYVNAEKPYWILTRCFRFFFSSFSWETNPWPWNSITCFFALELSCRGNKQGKLSLPTDIRTRRPTSSTPIWLGNINKETRWPLYISQVKSVDETTIVMTEKPQNYVFFMRQEDEDGNMAEALFTELEPVKSRPSWKSNVDSLWW